MNPGSFVIRIALVAISAISVAMPGLAQVPQRGAQRPAVADSLAGNYLAALIAASKRDTTAAALYFREASRADPRNSELLERSFVAELADGNMPEAFRTAERLIVREPSNPLAHVALGVRALKNRQFVTARSHFGKGGGRGRRADLTAGLLNAWTYVGTGDLKRALELVDRFSEPQLQAYRNYFGGLMADVAGNKAEAGRRLKMAHESEIYTIRVADAFARFEARAGRRQEAERIYAQLSERNRNQPFVAAAMRKLADGGVPDPLVQTVAEGASEVLYNLGSGGGQGNDEFATVVYLQLATYLHGDNEVAIVTLAETYEQIGQLERAVSLFLKVPEDSGLRVHAIARGAYAMEQLGKGDDAIRLLETELQRLPKELDLLSTLAAIHRSKKRWADAIAASTRAVEAIGMPEPKHWNIFYGRGQAYERNKEWPKAEIDLKKALELIPEDPRDPNNARNRAHVLNYLAYSWVDQNMHIEQSFEMLRKAVELTGGKDGYIVDSLGWAFYRQGKYEEAVRELERAVELKPADPVINDHLGDAYWKVGRRDEARFKWSHARDLKPEPDDLIKIQRKLEVGLDAAAPAVATPAAEMDKAKPSGG